MVKTKNSCAGPIIHLLNTYRDVYNDKTLEGGGIILKVIIILENL